MLSPEAEIGSFAGPVMSGQEREDEAAFSFYREKKKICSFFTGDPSSSSELKIELRLDRALFRSQWLLEQDVSFFMTEKASLQTFI